MRRIATLLTWVVALALAGCAPLACPAVGYSSSVEVTVEDAAVVDLECVAGCEPGFVDAEGAGAAVAGPTWRFEAPKRPTEITVVGRDSEGGELLREVVSLEWTVADPGNRCGSSASAAPILLTE